MTLSGVFTNFESFVPDIYKRGLVEILLHRSFRLCSNYENFHREIETLKSILKRNSYPHNLVNHRIKKFLNKIFVQRDLNFTVFQKGVDLLFTIFRFHLIQEQSYDELLKGIYHFVN